MFTYFVFPSEAAICEAYEAAPKCELYIVTIWAEINEDLGQIIVPHLLEPVQMTIINHKNIAIKRPALDNRMQYMRKSYSILQAGVSSSQFRAKV